MDYNSFGVLRKRSLYQWIFQLMGFLFVAPGGAVSQFPPPADLCTSPLMRGGRIFISDVPEDLPLGTAIGNLQLEGSATEIALDYAEPRNRHIDFDPISQNLTINFKLDREQYDYIDITVICEMLSRGFKIPIEIKITIMDVNDNPPQFIGDPYYANVSELMPVGATILSGVQASDADGDNWKVTFEVLQDTPYADHFEFPTETGGSLILTKPLDYEEIHSIELHIVARDHHAGAGGSLPPQLNTTTTAIIQIYDGDDQNPLFSRPSYLAYVTENAPVGTAIEVIPPLQAMDLDYGINATVGYTFVQDTIHNPPQSDYFEMNNVTGFISLSYDVLRRGEQFALSVQATQVDNPNRYSTAVLYIQVQAANENEPRFIDKQYTVSLLESVPVESYVTTVSALDNDVDKPNSGESFTYSVFEEGTVLTYGFTRPDRVNDFSINPITGVIQTLRPLSYEREPRYNVSINVTDGRWFDFSVLILDLINVNNNNPTFDRNVYNFQGHKEPNFYIGKVEATDVDVGSSVTYSLVQNNSIFSITPNGEIYLVGNPEDVEDNDVIRLFVTAEDEATPPRKDSAVAVVTFGVGAAVTMAAQTDLVVIIILGVLSGCLLLIIAVLSIYIYRNQHSPHSNTQPYNPDVDHIDAYFETSKSFERGINDLPADYHSNHYVDSSEGVYKPTSRDRHLAIYHDVTTDGTTVQESPFQSQRAVTPSSRSSSQPRMKTTPRGSTDTKNSFTGYSAQSLGQADPYSRQPRSDPHYSHADPHSRSRSPDPHQSQADNRSPHRHRANTSNHYAAPRDSGMHAVNEIDYDTALAAMEDDGKVYSSPSNSDPSFRGSGASLSTFKVGNSTQALVPPHSPAGSSVFRGKGSSVSFIDDHQVNVYHPDNAINPGSREKPEITVYY